MLKNPFRYPIRVWEPIEKPITFSETNEIKKLWQTHKVIPPHLEDVFYEVLAYYPELKETYVIVVETKFYGIQHTLRSYPPLLSLPNKRKDRVYPIVINTNKRIPNHFHSFSKEEQIGMLAHEFAHMLDYTKRTSPQIIGFSFNWFSKKFVRNLEHAIDKTAIARGCGNNLLCYRKKLLEKVNPKLESYLEQTYLKPEEIINEEKRNNLPIEHINPSQVTDEQNHSNSKPKTISKIFYSIITGLSAIPAISQMMYLVYIKRMHKKPNWYTK